MPPPPKGPICWGDNDPPQTDDGPGDTTTRSKGTIVRIVLEDYISGAPPLDTGYMLWDGLSRRWSNDNYILVPTDDPTVWVLFKSDGTFVAVIRETPLIPKKK